MYKSTSDNEQNRLRRLWLSDLQGQPFDELPPEQQRENLVSRIKQLRELAAKETSPIRKKVLGQVMQEVNLKINAIRPAIRGNFGVEHFFMDVARNRMTKAQFNIWLTEASDLMRLVNSKGQS